MSKAPLGELLEVMNSLISKQNAQRQYFQKNNTLRAVKYILRQDLYILHKQLFCTVTTVYQNRLYAVPGWIGVGDYIKDNGTHVYRRRSLHMMRLCLQMMRWSSFFSLSRTPWQNKKIRQSEICFLVLNEFFAMWRKGNKLSLVFHHFSFIFTMKRENKWIWLINYTILQNIVREIFRILIPGELYFVLTKWSGNSDSDNYK